MKKRTRRSKPYAHALAASAEIEAARFEQIHIDFQEKQWLQCRTHCQEYLDHFPQNTFTAHVWRYLATADYHLAAENSDPAPKVELAKDLETLLKHEKTLTAAERSDWIFLLAKTDYELGRFEPAIQILEQMISGDPNFPLRANATFLLALCYRDGMSDFERFCTRAEEALALHADLLDEASIHIALFNGYLAKSPQSIDLAAQHLYQASQKTEIEPDNLRWLSDYYFSKSAGENQDSIIFLQRAFDTLNQFLTELQSKHPRTG